MRRTIVLVIALVLAGCAETVRCPPGEVFGRDGACVPIPDAGPPRDASAADAN